jgi:hypothetical protein
MSSKQTRQSNPVSDKHWLLRFAGRRQRFHLALLRGSALSEVGMVEYSMVKKSQGSLS